MSGDGTLRKTRSTGDIPTTDIQRPGQVYIASSSRYSESNSDAADRTLPLNDETQDTFLLTVSSTMSRELQRADPGLGQVQSAAPAVVELPEDAQAQATVQHPVPVATVDQHNRLPPRLHNRSLYSRTMAYFGYGRDASRARRSLVALLWNLGWGFVQVRAATIFPSITNAQPRNLYLDRRYYISSGIIASLGEPNRPRFE